MSDYSRKPTPEEEAQDAARWELHKTKVSILIKNGLTFAELKGLLYSNGFANDYPNTGRLQQLTQGKK